MKRSKHLPQPWTPFVPADTGIDPRVSAQAGFIGVYINSRYQVQMTEYESPMGRVLWLAIVNRDRSAKHDWRDFQRIKNELCGPEREAIELYPAESRLVDTNNQFHLFVMPEGQTVPLGYVEREVSTEQEPGSAHKQRAFEQRPKDLDAVKHEQPIAPVFGASSAEDA